MVTWTKKIIGWLAAIGGLLLVLVTFGAKKRREGRRQGAADQILKESDDFQKQVDKMDPDDAADALDRRIDERLDRIERKRKR